MKLRDYLPLKAVVEDLGVSRWTLWRASRSGIAGFPKATKVGRQIYWKKSEIDALEDALMRFEGRCVFDSKRQHERRCGPPRRRANAPRAPSNAISFPSPAFGPAWKARGEHQAETPRAATGPLGQRAQARVKGA